MAVILMDVSIAAAIRLLVTAALIIALVNSCAEDFKIVGVLEFLHPTMGK